MLAQSITWFFISNTENFNMKAYFNAPWYNTPNAHVTMFATELDERQLECADFEVIISDVDKTIFFVGKMDLSSLFENKFLKNYNETADKFWKTTVDTFTNEYDREIIRTKREGSQKEYNIDAALRKHNFDRNFGAPQEAPNLSAATME